MRKTTKYLVQAAVIGALYAVLTHLQNLLLPGSATWANRCECRKPCACWPFLPLPPCRG